MTDNPIYSFGLTDVGGRPTNEDALHIGDRREPAKIAARGHLYVVADGTGGQEGGRTASAWAAEVVGENYYDNASTDLGESLRTAIQSAHRALFRLSEEVTSWRSMSTTIVAVVVKGRDAWIAHVGDSRVYLVRGGKAQPLTQDHTWQEDDDNFGSLTRWLGGGDQPTVEVDLKHETLQDGDVLILCTDGLYSQVSKEDMVELSGRLGVKPVVQQMIALAKARGTTDNTSAIAVRLGGAAIEGAQKRRQLVFAGAGGLALLVVIGLVIAGGGGSKPPVNGPVTVPDKPTSGPAVIATLSDDDTTPTLVATPLEATQLPGVVVPTSTRKPTITPTATSGRPTPRPNSSAMPAATSASGNVQLTATVPSCPNGQFWDPVMNKCKGTGGGGGSGGGGGGGGDGKE